jgi:hypothetical protein
VNPFVTAFYDAVILYATALNETLEAGGSISNGTEITRRMWGKTFQGKALNPKYGTRGCFFGKNLFIYLFIETDQQRVHIDPLLLR